MSGSRKKLKKTQAVPAEEQPPAGEASLPQVRFYRKHPLLTVFLLALFVRGVYLWQISDAPFFDLRVGDGNAYHRWATAIAGGDWLGEGVFYQAPLYPYFLAVLYQVMNDSTQTARIVQSLLGCVSCTLLASAGVSLFGPRGVIAGVLLALYPPAIFQESLIEKTALITLLTTGLLYLFSLPPAQMTARRLAGAGIVLGFLALVRENALVLAVPVMLWIGLERASGSWRQRLPAFVAGCLLVLAPVGIRNLVLGGEFHLTTAQFGPNFYIGNHAGADGTYQPLVEGHGNAVFERDDATRLAEETAGRKLKPSEVSSYWTKKALDYIVSHPVDWLSLTMGKLGVIVNARERVDTESQLVYAEWSGLLRLLGPFDFGVILVLAAMGIVFTLGEWRRVWFLYTIVAVYGGSTALFYIFARYRFPMAPAIILLATAGLVYGWDAIQAKGESGGRNWRRLSVAAGIAVVAAVVSRLPLVDNSIDRPVNYLNIASGLAQHPEGYPLAVEFYERTIREDEQWPPPRYGLGSLLVQMGRAHEAIPHLQVALSVWPNYPEAHHAMSLALLAVGRPAEAMREYNEALRNGFRPE